MCFMFRPVTYVLFTKDGCGCQQFVRVAILVFDSDTHYDNRKKHYLDIACLEMHLSCVLN